MRILQPGKKALVALSALSLSATGLPPSAHAHTWGGDWDDGWGWGHMIFGSIMMLLFWGGLVVLIVLAVRWIGGGPTRGGNHTTSRNRALEILEERYARGEIDKDEFEERRHLLSK